MNALITAATALVLVTSSLAEEKLKEIDPFSDAPETFRIIQDDNGPAYESKVPFLTLKKRFEEPLLDAEQNRVPESYRFTYFPTFRNPWTIRLTVRGEESGELVVKRLSGKGGYDPGKLNLARISAIKGEAFKKLIGVLRAPDVARPYGDLTELQVGMLGGLDGSRWYLETRKGQDYRCADVWCADGLDETKKMMLEEGLTVYEKLHPMPFVEACRALMQAAELTFDDDRHGLRPR